MTGSDLQEFFKSPCSRGGDSFAGGNLEDQDLCDCIIEGSDHRMSRRAHRSITDVRHTLSVLNYECMSEYMSRVIQIDLYKGRQSRNSLENYLEYFIGILAQSQNDPLGVNSNQECFQPMQLHFFMRQIFMQHKFNFSPVKYFIIFFLFECIILAPDINASI